MNPNLQIKFQMLIANGWRCTVDPNPIKWPVSIRFRYPWVPQDVIDAMIELKEVISGGETCWFLTAREYSGVSESSFTWDEWERLSIEAACNDSEWIDQIRDFWNQHLPIALSVKNGYSYFALREDGSVVTGREPEFEEPTFFADNYGQFIALVDQNFTGQP